MQNLLSRKRTRIVYLSLFTGSENKNNSNIFGTNTSVTVPQSLPFKYILLKETLPHNFISPFSIKINFISDAYVVISTSIYPSKLVKLTLSEMFIPLLDALMVNTNGTIYYNVIFFLMFRMWK